MKLTTLLEYQRNYNAMRAAVLALAEYSSTAYMEALRASGTFDYELQQHIKDTQLEIT